MKAHFQRREFVCPVECKTGLTGTKARRYAGMPTHPRLHLPQHDNNQKPTNQQINKRIFYIFTIFLDLNVQLEQGNTPAVRTRENFT